MVKKKYVNRIAVVLAVVVLSIAVLLLVVGGTEARADAEYRMKFVSSSANVVTYDGDWRDVNNKNYTGGKFSESPNGDGSVTCAFDSDTIYVLGAAGAKGLTFSVTLDGTEKEDVTVNSTSETVLYSLDNLEAGEHTLTINVKSASLRLSGFYVKQTSIGTGVEELSADNAVFNYSYMAAADKYYYVDDKTNGSVSCKIDTLNLKELRIMSSKKSDSAKIEVYIDGNRKAEVNLKGAGGSNVCVYTVSSDAFDAYKPLGSVTLEIKVVYVNGASYFEFYGLELVRYYNEDDWDKDDYVLGGEISDTLVKNSRDKTATNLSHNFTEIGNALTASQANKRIDFTFCGSALEIRADVGPDKGKFNVLLNDEMIAKVNTYSQTAANDTVVFRKTDFAKFLGSEYIYKVSLVSLYEKSWDSTGYQVTVRGFDVYAEEGTDVDNADCDAFDMHPQKEFTLPEGYEYKNVEASAIVSETFAHSSDGYFSNSVGATMNIKFRGTGFEIYGTTGLDKGKAEISIDGELVGRINCYDTTVALNTLFARIDGLSLSNHTCTIIIVNEKSANSSDRYVTLTSMRAINRIGDVDKSAIIDDSSYLVRSDGFGTDKKSSYYGGTSLFSNDMSSSTYITFSFQGTSIKIFGTKNTDSGVGTVLVDGKEVYRFNARAASIMLQAVLIEITDLEPDVNHTVKLYIEPDYNQVGARAYLVLDYFEVENYAEAVFAGWETVPAGKEDCGKHPELVYKIESDEDLRESAPSNVKNGCHSSFDTSRGIVIALFPILAALTFAAVKNKKANGVKSDEKK